jgi:RNA polymerase sigma-70 factor (ECF subfamily)
MQTRDDEYHLERIRKGDTKSFAHLVERHKDLVFTLVVRITGNREDAEEVSQDVFLKAYQKLDQFKGDSKFSTWLYRIAFNEAVSKTRKRSLITVQLKEEIQESMTDEVGSHEIMGLNSREQKVLINHVLEKLNEIENTIVTLFYLEESSINEIAEITGMTVSNVKVKLHRIRKKMHHIMSRYFENRVHTLN